MALDGVVALAQERGVDHAQDRAAVVEQGQRGRAQAGCRGRSWRSRRSGPGSTAIPTAGPPDWPSSSPRNPMPGVASARWARTCALDGQVHVGDQIAVVLLGDRTRGAWCASCRRRSRRPGRRPGAATRDRGSYGLAPFRQGLIDLLEHAEQPAGARGGADQHGRGVHAAGLGQVGLRHAGVVAGQDQVEPDRLVIDRQAQPLACAAGSRSRNRDRMSMLSLVRARQEPGRVVFFSLAGSDRLRRPGRGTGRSVRRHR